MNACHHKTLLPTTAVALAMDQGRDNVDAKWGIPAFNTAFLGVLSFPGAWLISYERAAEVLNFGAFLGFLGVNALYRV